MPRVRRGSEGSLLGSIEMDTLDPLDPIQQQIVSNVEVNEAFVQSLQQPDTLSAHDFVPLLESIESENLKIDTPAQVGTSLVIPREIPRDTVHLSTELLGEGHFGTVVMGMLYPDDDTIMPYEIAAKTLKQNVSVPNVAKERFYREAAISCQFKHRNIVGCIGVITVDEPSVIIMQCCGKGSLERVLVKDIAPSINSRASKLPPSLEKKLLGYAINIASGLEHMHTKNFVHRDIAVRNVLVTALDICVISVSLHGRRHTYIFRIFFVLNVM